MNVPPGDPLARLPHRPPFRFVTRIAALEGGVRAAGVWIVTGHEDFIAAHFPGDPLVPGVLIGEALAQLSGAINIQPGAHGRLAHIDVRFRAPVAPPAQIELESVLTRTLGSLSMYDVSARVGGTIVAEGTIVLGGPDHP